MPIRYDWLCDSCREQNCDCQRGNTWLEWKLSGQKRDCTYCGKKDAHTLKCICDLRKCESCGHSFQSHEQYSDRFTKYKCCEVHQGEERCVLGYWCKTCNSQGKKCLSLTKELVMKTHKKPRFEEDIPAGTLHEQVLAEDHQLKASGGEQ